LAPLVASKVREIFAFYEQGKLQPDTAKIFALDRAAEALAALRDRRLDARAVLPVRKASTRKA
jgi:D-arabinose 1-dehydrogenase-like Zn-dependent alcohol dehydrogenase